MNAVAANTNAVRPVATGKTIKVWEIRSKDRVGGGNVYPGTVTKGHHAEIVPGVSIRLFGDKGERVVLAGEGVAYGRVDDGVYRVDFKIGDIACYGGRNIDYTGVITSITAKTITVVDGSTTRRLELRDFDHYNYDFDRVKSEKRNAEWMD